MGENDRADQIEIAGLATDSRKVRPGYLFAAFPGARTDGARFVADAIERGAVAVLTKDDVDLPGDQIYRLAAANPRHRFATLVARFYGPQPDTIAAVTGTNGKTSVASFTRQIWQTLGHDAASIGTLGVTSRTYEYPLSLTTPDPITLHEQMRELKRRGIDHVICEASSHGLAQYRLDGLNIRAAAFTNLTRDHLDYHESEDAYFYAKARLFGEVMKPGGVAVINIDDPHARDLEYLCWGRGHKIIRVGTEEGEIRLLQSHPVDGGQALTVSHGAEVYDLTLPLVGAFQASNALVAAGLVIGNGADPEAALKAIEHLRAVPGRLEVVGRHPVGARVYVDYAHTPDALKSVLLAVRPHVEGKLVVVFGCGGDRDKGKRPVMGSIAAAHADRVYVTDDNPRSEEASRIRKDIMERCPGAIEIGDRRQAIREAVASLEKGDVLVIAGKGHETGQIVGDRVLPFSDVEEARSAIAAVSGGRRL
ncbi:MAG: UDP-N-acetylmuramoyl-L-alanyl-D-glutamate--2,6-diaminopimelate ligase [Alphaproteobacteria bacterium]|nr:MAG: UDP-N-acetylmuramoyl-L-alanyl-D-glutamate--2,6-diaminopimelate ligase [Alphaproteobacteria bacterium]